MPSSSQNPAGLHRLLIGLLIAMGLMVLAVFGQRAWSQPNALTQRFETCMEQAPFKQHLAPPSPEAVLTPVELQQHLDSFDRIRAETGLPPIWNGSTLVPWTVFHRESIEIARQCHAELNIDEPQRQLQGTYAKPVWDPGSPIWNNP